MSECATLFPPLPEGRRGFRINVDATSKKRARYAYTNAHSVYIRSFDDPNDIVIFNEHRCQVLAVKFSPNGEWMASGDARGRVFVWSIATFVIKIEVEVNSAIYDIAWSHDGQRIVAVGDGKDSFGRAFIWNTGSQIGEMVNHSRSILAADFKPSRPFRIVTASEDTVSNFYKGPPFKLMESFDDHERYVNCARFSATGDFYVTVGADKKIFLFDGKTGQMIKQFVDEENRHSSSIISVAWNPDGSEILTSSMDKTSKIWNVESGTVTTTFSHHDNPTIGDQMYGAIWHKDHIMSVSFRGEIAFLDRENPNVPLKIQKAHQGRISSLATDWVNKVAYSGDADGRILRWEQKEDNGFEVSNAAHDDKILGIAVTASGDNFLTMSLDNTVACGDFKDNAYNDTRTDLGGQPAGICASRSDPSLCFVATKGKTIQILRDGAVETTHALPVKPTSLCISPDDSHAFFSGDDQNIYRIDLGSGECSQVADKHNADIVAMDYSPNGNLVVSADKGRYIYLWNPADFSAPLNKGWKFHNATVVSAQFSPNSERLLTAGLDGQILVFKDLETFKKNRVIIEESHYAGCVSAKFLDDTTVVSAGNDRCVKIWNILE